MNGVLLGTQGDVQLPSFATVAPYRSPDGLVEVDALAENEERWAVEIKWRGKAAGKKELAAFLRKADALAARPWFISRSGFTPAARDYATEHGILISSRADLEALSRLARDGRASTPKGEGDDTTNR